jgi:hypothetical protein
MNMRCKFYYLSYLFAFFIIPLALNAQQKGLDVINSADLKLSVQYLASDKMKGRKTGEEGNNMASKYLSDLASILKLKPLDEQGTFFQKFEITRTSLLKDSSWISIAQGGRKCKLFTRSLIVNPLPNEDKLIEAPVIFAGYGINSPEDNYNDLYKIDAKDKILMVMDRAPSSPDGKSGLLKDIKWMKSANMDAKYFNLISLRPKAILFVLDPKSQHKSIDEVIPDASNDLSEQFALTEIRSLSDMLINSYPAVFIISQDIADSILRPSNYSLKSLQEKIDMDLRPHSMEIPATNVSLHIGILKERLETANVAGMIEGGDLQGKNDAIVFTAHFDHIGMDSKGNPNNGADDNSSGTAALIQIAKAFKEVQKSLKRSIILLWVSGEELGLMGSKYYTERPLFPLGNTIADINLDMVGRSWTPQDTGIVKGDRVDVKRGDSIYASGGKNCSELIKLNDSIANLLGMQIDYSYNSPDDPKGMYFRSDHYSFAQKKIPVLYYTTGIHRDYHSPGDVASKLDYRKLEKVTKLAFLLGYEIATREKKIEVDK